MVLGGGFLGFNIVMKKQALDVLEGNQKAALATAMRAAFDDLIKSQSMPYETGFLQDRQTYLDYSEMDKGLVALVSDTEYAAKLYFHPEYRFRTDVNKMAGGRWFDAYIDGDKRDFLLGVYAKELNQLNEKGG